MTRLRRLRWPSKLRVAGSSPPPAFFSVGCLGNVSPLRTKARYGVCTPSGRLPRAVDVAPVANSDDVDRARPVVELVDDAKCPAAGRMAAFVLEHQRLVQAPRVAGDRIQGFEHRCRDGDRQPVELAVSGGRHHDPPLRGAHLRLIASTFETRPQFLDPRARRARAF